LETKNEKGLDGKRTTLEYENERKSTAGFVQLPYDLT
jgi:hypothetical protein